jgi:hypothetical protein
MTTLSPLDNYAQNRRVFIDAVEERSVQLGEAARGNSISIARQVLQTVADPTDELALLL